MYLQRIGRGQSNGVHRGSVELIVTFLIVRKGCLKIASLFVSGDWWLT